MSAKRIGEIAAAAGASLSEPLSSSEVVGFQFCLDGTFNIHLASGEMLVSAGLQASLYPGDREEHRDLYIDLVKHLTTLTAGGTIRTGVQYHRRIVQVAEGERASIFAEAGR